LGKFAVTGWAFPPVTRFSGNFDFRSENASDSFKAKDSLMSDFKVKTAGF